MYRRIPRARSVHSAPVHAKVRYLLLQVRNPDDPMREHEVRCFARALRCPEPQIAVMDLLRHCPTLRELDKVDIVLLGGSGDYSVATGGPWLDLAMEAMRELADFSKPTFASCWGFQAMVRALGGVVVTDLHRAEVGTHTMHLTPEGAADPIFGPLGERFPVQIGHQDIVDRLPDGAVLLASTDRVKNQAFRLEGKPIYATQFHPELNRSCLLDRLYRYPEYVEKIAGLPLAEFIATCKETPETDMLLERFVELVMS
ncbi:MAG: type 1 glutamine amidotransferase [Planctomycetes bacterium]|nr:type 1 glutamine amidotransferase [Planctomycetota bacterium]